MQNEIILFETADKEIKLTVSVKIIPYGLIGIS